MADPRAQASERLANRNFLGLCLTQFSGAVNDNALKGVILGIVAVGMPWEDVLGKGGTGWVSVMLTAPFVLLLGYAGQLADRHRKDRVIIATRVAEIFIGLLVLLGFWIDAPWVVLVGYVLLASESAFFSPAKYGSVVEVVGKRHVSTANGVMSMTTNIAIIAGLAIAGPLREWSSTWTTGRTVAGVAMGPFTLVGVAIVLIAMCSLGSSLCMRGLVAANPGLRRDWNPFGTYVTAIRMMRPGVVWDAVVAWSLFWGAAALVVAIIPDYQEPMRMTPTSFSLLLAAFGIGIGPGSVFVGLLSGPRIRGGIVVVGGLGCGAIFTLLGVLTPQDFGTGLAGYWILWGLLFTAAFFAGLYLIPLITIQMVWAPMEGRARILCTANALCFLMMTVTGGVFALVRHFDLIPPHGGFIAAGVLLLGSALWIWIGRGRTILHCDTPA